MEELKYAQVVKERKGEKVVNIEKLIKAVKKILTYFFPTSHIELENLILRQDNNRVTRKNIRILKKRQITPKPRQITNDQP